jgi:hypothetical protein
MVMSNRLATENKRYFMLFLGIGFLHFIMTIVYYFLSRVLGNDSIGYYYEASYVYNNWEDAFGQGIYFIYFLVYPLVKYLGLTYLGCFFLFSFVGLIAFYKLFKVYTHLFNNEWNNWLYLLLLPNMHFWSVAIGKDVLMFYGFSLVLYNYYFKKPIINYVFPLLLMGFIRIHVLFFFFTGLVVAQLFFNKEMKFYLKALLVSIVSGIVLVTMPYFLELVGAGKNASIANRLDMFEAKQFEGASTSENMHNANILYKSFSYLFRPLFYDVHSILSVVASFENLLWVLMFYTIVKYYKLKSVPRLKKYFWYGVIIIVCVLLPSVYTLNNIGIALRQKHMISPFLLFVFYIAIIDNTTYRNKNHSDWQILSYIR